MESWLVVTCAVILSVASHSNAQDHRAEVDASLRGCMRHYGIWKLMSITFLPHMSKVEERDVILREVVLRQKKDAPTSTSEIIIKHNFEAYSRYVHLNGTKIFPTIADAGQVPKTVRGKVTNVMQRQKGGSLFGKKKMTEELYTKFKCTSQEEIVIDCVVVLRTKRYKVPFTAFVRAENENEICRSNGVWEKVGDPVLEFVIRVKTDNDTN